MAPVNICLIGHRGVGKTTFLNHGPPGARARYDLDQEIERATGRTVGQIFTEDGEAAFRALERDRLAWLLARPEPKIIAVGAGFTGPKPAGARVVWLRRSTDAAGRIFRDRPRLNADATPLAEYLERFPARERLYREWADLTLMLPEGYDGGLDTFLGEDWRVPYDLSLPAGAAWPAYAHARASWGWRRLEVRDDVTPILPEPPPARLLRAYRRGDAAVPGAEVEEDWALELGPPPRPTTIVSAHAGRVATAAVRLARFDGAIQKLAVTVTSFGELIEGHRWWGQDPARRAFLPRDPAGRWRWYRSLFGPRMPLHFVREGDDAVLDQPPLWQMHLQPPLVAAFAAVLGHPVEHSRTPIEHHAYFKTRKMPVVAIEVRVDEWDAAIPALIELGLTHAAVTAPLKTRAFALATDPNPDAVATRAANTLWFAPDDRVYAANTDVIALRTLARTLVDRPRAWLWGGGGVKSSVRAAWPEVREVSARAGVPDHEVESPDLLIWAVGRSRAHRVPPAHLRPGLVLDLNYADDSPGLEYAVGRGLPYQSGLDMFKLQARAQREFWDAREAAHAGQSIW